MLQKLHLNVTHRCRGKGCGVSITRYWYWTRRARELKKEKKNDFEVKEGMFVAQDSGNIAAKTEHQYLKGRRAELKKPSTSWANTSSDTMPKL